MDQGAKNSSPVKYECATIEEFQQGLQETLFAAGSKSSPVPVAAVFVLGPNVTVTTPALKRKPKQVAPTSEGNNDASSPLTSVSHLAEGQLLSVLNLATDQPALERVTRNAFTRAIINIFRELDGFGWTVKNITSNRDGWRVVYACNDSLETQSREKNREQYSKRGSTTATAKDCDQEQAVVKRQSATGNRSLLPLYDCRGSIFIIFSICESKVFVRYKHHAVHSTVAHRKHQESMEPTPHLQPRKQSDMQSSSDSQPSQAPPIRSSNLVQVQDFFELSELALAATNYLCLEQYQHLVAHQSSRFHFQPKMQANGATSPPHFPIDFPLDQNLRDRALALLRDRGVEVEDLSLEQLMVFENQDPVLQERSLQLLELFGPAHLEIKVPTAPPTVQLEQRRESTTMNELPAMPHSSAQSLPGCDSGPSDM